MGESLTVGCGWCGVPFRQPVRIRLAAIGGLMMAKCYQCKQEFTPKRVCQQRAADAGSPVYCSRACKVERWKRWKINDRRVK